MNVLIAFASTHGSTAEVAHAIGRVLLEHGHQVTIKNVKDVRSTQDYDVVMLGSAIHSGAWLPEMNDFMTTMLPELAAKPVYLWINCIRVLERYGYEHAVEHYLNYDLLSQINLRDKRIFAGKLELNATDWNERWTLAVRYDGGTWPSNFDGDFRDWDAIRTWAGKVAAEIKAAQSISTTK